MDAMLTRLESGQKLEDHNSGGSVEVAKIIKLMSLHDKNFQYKLRGIDSNDLNAQKEEDFMTRLMKESEETMKLKG